ncbi:hypothetical protein WJX73_008192 [Symbiochloris irregularis]|uniref:Coenzyme Q-binding protein COQ10 START domain-containing protein n=1 Tax=Symbiochloris irregularis TaxID=706552 RepID=A0AAW1NP18_9CHLO
MNAPALFSDACSKKHQERKLIRFSQEQIFSVAAEVENYKEFVPWCQRSVIVDVRDEDNFSAELEVGFKMFVERYTSEVTLTRPNKVVSKVSDSTLFNHLDTTWEFAPGPTPNTCWLSFRTDFEFKSPLYAQVANVFFDEVVRRMMGAFEKRCLKLYGNAPTQQQAGRDPLAYKVYKVG